MIYVSTGGESAQTAYKTSCEFLKFGIANIELSHSHCIYYIHSIELYDSWFS